MHVFGQPFAQLSVLLAGRSGRPLSKWFPRQDAAFFICNCAHVAVIHGRALSPFEEEQSAFWGEVCFIQQRWESQDGCGTTKHSSTSSSGKASGMCCLKENTGSEIALKGTA